jgi:hypothetical protein
MESKPPRSTTNWTKAATAIANVIARAAKDSLATKFTVISICLFVALVLVAIFGKDMATNITVCVLATLVFLGILWRGPKIEKNPQIYLFTSAQLFELERSKYQKPTIETTATTTSTTSISTSTTPTPNPALPPPDPMLPAIANQPDEEPLNVPSPPDEKGANNA